MSKKGGSSGEYVTNAGGCWPLFTVMMTELAMTVSVKTMETQR